PRRSSDLRRHAVPEEGMVPYLCCLVEKRLVARRLGSGNHLFEALTFELGASDQLVRLIDVSLMMLAVVEAQGPGRNMGLQCILGVGKRRKLKCHEISPFTGAQIESADRADAPSHLAGRMIALCIPVKWLTNVNRGPVVVQVPRSHCHSNAKVCSSTQKSKPQPSSKPPPQTLSKPSTAAKSSAREGATEGSAAAAWFSPTRKELW